MKFRCHGPGLVGVYLKTFVFFRSCQAEGVKYASQVAGKNASCALETADFVATCCKFFCPMPRFIAVQHGMRTRAIAEWQNARLTKKAVLF
jgi:hypothetical protein